MEKLVLRCRYTLGDVVLLTAAVRDLHLNWPGRYQTDVRTGFADLWEANPFLSRLHEYDGDVRVIDCDMPLVERSDQAATHALCGFVDFLSRQLAVPIRLTGFRGDIHLSREERRARSQVAELTGQDLPYWIINAGGKHDCTIKWWDPARFQEVIDHFRGRLHFVQVGRLEHWHPRLRGVIDLRGRTSLRDLVRLVHHADGVLCGVTALMHLAAAVPCPAGPPGSRPCVVVAGGREPAHWEAYPGHQFIHTVGALPCCAREGCWKSRTRPLGDGKDDPRQLCVDVRGDLPACMALIEARDVIRRVELYLSGGQAQALSSSQAIRAAEATAWSDAQPPLPAPLTFHNAPQAAAEFIAGIPPCPDAFAGRGIVICAGGARMYSNAWVCVQMLRRLGCSLPIELWHLGEEEMDGTMENLVRPLGVVCVNARTQAASWPAQVPGAWPLKPYALINSRFAQALLLDADVVPVRNPEFLFEHPLFHAHGAVFWPDEGRLARDAPAWKLFDVAYRDEPEVESGQVLVDKKRCWAPLLLCMWYNEHCALFYQQVHGDKETFHLAFRRMDFPYAMAPHPVTVVDGAFYQHDFDGRRLFQHRNGDKWDLSGRNRSLPGFQFEEECREILRDLAGRWDGRITWLKEAQAKAAAAAGAGEKQRPVPLAVVMASCAARESGRVKTLEGLSVAGWPQDQVRVVVDEGRFRDPIDNLTHTAWRGLQAAFESGAELTLYLEDDLAFNRHLMENLRGWGPLVRRELHVGSLCNLGFHELAWDVPGHMRLVHPSQVLGTQSVLLSRQMLRYCLDHWFEGPPDLDLKLRHLARQARQPFFYHYPSLVQHVGRRSTLGNHFREAVDFDEVWKTSAAPGLEFVPGLRAPRLERR